MRIMGQSYAYAWFPQVPQSCQCERSLAVRSESALGSAGVPQTEAQDDIRETQHDTADATDVASDDGIGKVKRTFRLNAAVSAAFDKMAIARTRWCAQNVNSLVI